MFIARYLTDRSRNSISTRSSSANAILISIFLLRARVLTKTQLQELLVAPNDPNNQQSGICAASDTLNL